jgi:hypothetical protein
MKLKSINSNRMRYFQFTVFFCLLSFSLQSQSADSIIARLKYINRAVVNKSCSEGSLPLISNRAMNIFLADKTGYLSESTDLSFFTNYVTLNTAEGKLTINHNFQQATGIDEPIKKLFSVGVSANIANGFAAGFLDKKFENELGLTLNYKWLSKVKTHCNNGPADMQNKQSMDALRAGIVYSLETEIKEKEAAFITAINHIHNTDIPGLPIDTAKALMLKNFHENMEAEYAEKFARLQAETLTKTNHFRLITTSWTSLTTCVPLAFPAYSVAASLISPFSKKHPYNLALMLIHTRMWESAKTGRLFLTMGGNLLFNNSKLSYRLDKISMGDYKNLGGTDTIHLAGLNNSPAYIGLYQTFLTPSLNARIVYFSPSSHVGVSFLLEQSFGKYNLLNGRLGIPIILINSKKTPAVNIEFQVLFFDMGKKIAAEKKYGNKTGIGVSIGIPFSRLMF